MRCSNGCCDLDKQEACLYCKKNGHSELECIGRCGHPAPCWPTKKQDTKPRQDEETSSLDHSHSSINGDRLVCSFCPSNRGHNDGHDASMASEKYARWLENYRTSELVWLGDLLSKRRQGEWLEPVVPSMLAKCSSEMCTVHVGPGSEWCTGSYPLENSVCVACGLPYCWGGKHCSARDKGNVLTRWVVRVYDKACEWWWSHGLHAGW